MYGCQCGDYCAWCSPLASDIKIKPEYSTRVYGYVTTSAGKFCTSQAGIGAGVLVNISAVNEDGTANIWTVNAWGRMYTDSVALSTLKGR